ncbi:hypothetical protein FMEAI12_3560017 [Parafrankia sp. Ea1.12]|uniref:hypothetical protein n=1 Tax=Parafrankia sp. Ea1.12 TaxID=573499 RepID=UPI000DA58EFF|nr:hypothetical protein [Parafrankia sp. Ea1.12]SQD96272.1 hypothetical protein FMEAI12_3560017 [Parafrankia sp. Ea1.12]
MTTAHHLDAARQRATAAMARHTPETMYGLVVPDWRGRPVRIVGWFGSEQAAQAWVSTHGLTGVLVLPFSLPR